MSSIPAVPFPSYREVSGKQCGFCWTQYNQQADVRRHACNACPGRQPFHYRSRPRQPLKLYQPPAAGGKCLDLRGSSPSSLVCVQWQQPTDALLLRACAGEDALADTLQYLEQLSAGLAAGEPAALALVEDNLLPAFVDAVARETAAAAPEVRHIPVS